MILCFGYEFGHVPIMQKLLVPREFIQFRPVGRDDFAVEIFGAKPPVPAFFVFDNEIPKVVVTNDLDRLDSRPRPATFDTFK